MELCWGQYLDLEYQAGQPPSLKDYLNMVALKTGTPVGACCEVAGNPAGMINPSLLIFLDGARDPRTAESAAQNHREAV